MRNLFAGLALAALSIGSGVAAQEFPTRNISIIVPYAPGATDQLARVLAEGMSARLGQTVTVETRPGAGGSVGANFVAGAEPDGHTLLLAVSTVQTLAPQLQDLPYGFDDLAPVARVAVGPNVIAARANADFKTIGELVAFAKANPGVVSYGSAGAGSATHITAEAFARAAGIELFHIPFPGVTPALAAAVAGEVDLVIGYASTILPQAEGGAVVALGQLSEERTSVAPDLTTVREAGVDVVLPPSIGIWTAAGTPEAAITALSDAVGEAVQSEAFVEFARAGMTEIGFAPAPEFAALMAAENTFFQELLPQVDLQQ